MPSNAPFDSKALAAATGGDGALARELLALYAVRAERLSDDLRTAPLAKRRALRDLAHGARGSALAVGAAQVAQAAADLEAAAAEGGDAERIGRARDRLLILIEESRRAALRTAGEG